MTATQFHGVTSPPKLPIPMLTDVAPRDEGRHVVTPVDRDGRLADRSLLTLLGWSPRGGDRNDRRARPHRDRPARSRRSGRRPGSPPPAGGGAPQLRNHPGDRVLLAADQHAGELLIIPNGVVTRMIDAYRHALGQAGAP
jgi:hypothetical protein